jgi:hypothetical protein
VPGRVVSLRDDDVDAGLDLALGLPRLADEAEYLHAALVRGLDDEGGAPEAGHEHGRALLEDDVELLPRDLLVEAAPLCSACCPFGSGTLYFSLIICAKRRCSSGMPAISFSSVSAVGAEAGSTRSMPNGFDPTRLLIHRMSAAISSACASPRRGPRSRRR